MPIQPTAEMVSEIYSRLDFHSHDDTGIREGLVAVLAIVQRDYRLSQYCNAELMPEVACKRLAGTRHKHEALLPTGNRVEWS